ncbi:hypothetical protein EJ07DRAFT_158745 [Lizonia empirigonia]|nr:hypothetical protein EJ07DRAFT_158745 [Lizonia empirigonia]
MGSRSRALLLTAVNRLYTGHPHPQRAAGATDGVPGRLVHVIANAASNKSLILRIMNRGAVWSSEGVIQTRCKLHPPYVAPWHWPCPCTWSCSQCIHTSGASEARGCCGWNVSAQRHRSPDSESKHSIVTSVTYFECGDTPLGSVTIFERTGIDRKRGRPSDDSASDDSVSRVT